MPRSMSTDAAADFRTVTDDVAPDLKARSRTSGTSPKSRQHVRPPERFRVAQRAGRCRGSPAKASPSSSGCCVKAAPPRGTSGICRARWSRIPPRCSTNRTITASSCRVETSSRRRPLALRFASLAGFTACGGSLFHSNEPPVSVYQLSVPAAASARPRLPADLAVMPVRVHTGLDNAEIAVLYPDRRLDHFAGARWSGPLDELLEDLAMQACARPRRTSAMCIPTPRCFPPATGSRSMCWISRRNTRASRAARPPAAHVRLVARIGASADRRILGEFDAEARQPAADNRLTAVVKAYNDAVGAALGKISAEAADAVSNDLVRR